MCVFVLYLLPSQNIAHVYLIKCYYSWIFSVSRYNRLFFVVSLSLLLSAYFLLLVYNFVFYFSFDKFLFLFNLWLYALPLPYSLVQGNNFTDEPKNYLAAVLMLFKMNGFIFRERERERGDEGKKTFNAALIGLFKRIFIKHRNYFINMIFFN